MKKQWVGSDEEFFQNLFAYLKAKFPYKLSAMEPGQNNTGLTIYKETIVALEQIHEVLRKIENGSAPNRDDYEDAVQKNNEEKVQEIIDFYKKLALVQQLDAKTAFYNFCRSYYWDPLIASYAHFLDKHSELYEQFSSSTTWNQKTFKKDVVFGFIEAYQVSVLQIAELPEHLKVRVELYDQRYERLMADFDGLVERNLKIGVSVFDITLLGSLLSEESTKNDSPPSFLFKVDRYLQADFEANDAILMQLNHLNKISNNHFIVSYLLVYKSTVYQSHQQVMEFVSSAIYAAVGGMNCHYVTLHERERMLKKIFPNDVFVGELTSRAKKQAFRNGFLKYFLSSMFLLNLDKDSLFQWQEGLTGHGFNKYRFYREKIYLERGQDQNKKVPKVEPKPKYTAEYLRELALEGDQLKKINQHFSFNDLHPVIVKRIEILRYLYLQQSVTSVSQDVLEDLIRIEIFLARLMNTPVFAFERIIEIEKFEKSPKFSKLSLLFRQFALILHMDCWRDKRRLPAELSAKSIHFIRRKRDFFERDYLISDLDLLKNQLNAYQATMLKSAFKNEAVLCENAVHNEKRIQAYLETVLNQDVSVIRCIFRCGNQVDKDKSKIFDDMFREYTENLKRRKTHGVRLIGQVGVYVPYSKEHYIDATLFFEMKNNDAMDGDDLRNAVIEYWESYVDHKWDQLQTYNKKRENPDSENLTNPFEVFEMETLSATCAPIVKTENLLNSEYLSISPKQKKSKNLLIESVSKFYSYCQLILIDELDLENSPRKQLLILGRNRKAKDKSSDEITDTCNDQQTQEPDTDKKQVLSSVDSDKQNDLVEADSGDASNAQSVALKLDDSANQAMPQQPNSEDDPEQNENSNQDKEFTEMGSPDSVSETNQPEQTNSDKQIGSQVQAKSIRVVPVRHNFVKPTPDQLAAEAKAKERFRDT
ncbi:hypothetical protein [Acinetobacter towneri]|uniref:hypothetical protein n=1 Tax=Acinetobacter towneri TaxID=202956 RepID=UPI002575E00C|nr:hypothetical protein [Acinetobacter towneri]MDM1721363.1 hypothetical protein [Acinetobacter towneri]